MKYLSKYLYSALILGAFFLASCGGEGTEPDPVVDAKETQAALIADKTFSLGSGAITQGGVTVEGWENFTLGFTGSGTGGSFNTTGSNADNVWPGSGTWTFTNDAGTEMTRDDDVVMTLTTGTSGVKLQFTIEEEVGRTVGTWVFNLDAAP